MPNENQSSAVTRIHINRQPTESPNPTTGDALYALANAGAHQELFQEEAGDHEDELVPRGHRVVHLKPDEHFYTEREFKIFVNTRQKETPKRELSFDDVVHLAFETPPTGPNVKFTIVYRKGPKRNPTGTMIAGTSVFIKDGMIFDVTPTDKS